jgi:hypothetical protein
VKNGPTKFGTASKTSSEPLQGENKDQRDEHINNMGK